MLTVQRSSVAVIERAVEFAALVEEYTAECAIDGLPSPVVKMLAYRELEQAGLLHVVSALEGDALIGFISVLAAPLPHYGIVVAVSESFFVCKAKRQTGAGLRLLRAAEDKARELGAPGLLVSAPFGGSLFKVLPRAGYTEASRTFFKACPR